MWNIKFSHGNVLFRLILTSPTHLTYELLSACLSEWWVVWLKGETLRNVQYKSVQQSHPTSQECPNLWLSPPRNVMFARWQAIGRSSAGEKKKKSRETGGATAECDKYLPTGLYKPDWYDCRLSQVTQVSFFFWIFKNHEESVNNLLYYFKFLISLISCLYAVI